MTTKSKNRKMHRDTATELLDKVSERIREYNANALMPFAIEEAVVFGSYVNDPGKEMLSDLDVALKVKKRFGDKDVTEAALYYVYELAIERAPSLAKGGYDFFHMYVTAYNEMLRDIRQNSKYLSLHELEGDREAVFSKKTIAIPVGEIDRDYTWFTEPLEDLE